MSYTYEVWVTASDNGLPYMLQTFNSVSGAIRHAYRMGEGSRVIRRYANGDTAPVWSYGDALGGVAV